MSHQKALILLLLTTLTLSQSKPGQDSSQIEIEGKTEAEKLIDEASASLENFDKEINKAPHPITLNLPYQDNEDYIISPLGLGLPPTFVPVQIDTTSYKTWVASSDCEHELCPKVFTYSKDESKSAVDEGDSDEVADEEGTVYGNVVKDQIFFNDYRVDDLKFIEVNEYDDDFTDFTNGKLGLGFCEYASEDDKGFCLMNKLKNKRLILDNVFSLKEASDTHGELVIGDITETMKGKDYVKLPIANKEQYEEIEDDIFKMSWLTNISHVIFRDISNKKEDEEGNPELYINALATSDQGVASLDSSSHYIEAPLSYIYEFEEKFFQKYFPNCCRQVYANGAYMFYCEAAKFDTFPKTVSIVLVLNGVGFEINSDLLFEKINYVDYEFFVHFKDFEQDTWNLGHPFFHSYAISFDADKKEIGVFNEEDKFIFKDIDVDKLPLPAESASSGWGKYILIALLGVGVLAAVFYLLRRFGIKLKLRKGVDPSLVDNESADDMSFNAGNIV